MAKKVLNLSGRRAADPPSSPSSASSSEDEQPRTQVDARASETEESASDEDEEFEIPPGFETVQGSSSITRESILPSDKELWFFKLPKHMDASALANTSFKLSKDTVAPGAAVASVRTEGKTYRLQHEDMLLTQQLVNAFPLAKERKKFSLGKPFTRCFSLVETRSALVKQRSAADEEEEEEEEETTTNTKAMPGKKTKKSKHSSSKAEPAKTSKKQKTAK